MDQQQRIRREALTDSESGMARLAMLMSNQIMAQARAQASEVIHRAQELALRYSNEAGDLIVREVKARGVSIADDETIKPELDPKTKSAVAILITRNVSGGL